MEMKLRSKEVVFDIYHDSDPVILAQDKCRDDYESCVHIASAAIELSKAKYFKTSLTTWTWNKPCK